MSILAVILVPAVLASLAFYSYISVYPHTRAHLLGSMRAFTDAPKRVLLLVAHPDDECMFFGPTLVQLTGVTGVTVFAVSASNGNGDGLGAIREKEFVASCKTLGIASERIAVWNDELRLVLLGDFPSGLNVPTRLENRKMQDGMKVWWKEEDVAYAVGKFVLENKIDVIITFDKYGISGHANHCAVSLGVKRLLQQPAFFKKVSGYALISVPLLRKFISLLDLVPSLLVHLRNTLRFKSKLYESQSNEEVRQALVQRGKERVLFVATPSELWRARSAMLCHPSQLVWFRHLYLAFSRYMVINELERM
ncbi:putative deacetylase LmbE-like domain-containing protein [Chytriomyces sp. MP71]|nr:putative deacetylase LmbE-like domain-containing protein [Chytriomyces sp. MP71]